MGSLEKKIGKIITIDGTDRTGKHTQATLLHERLKRESYKTALLDFPQYQSLSGEMVKEYLQGCYGSKEQLGAKLPSLLYAVNRFNEKEKLVNWLNNGYIVVLDRYMESNMTYQSAKLPQKERPAFLQWLETLEFGIFELPRSDLVIYLHVPTEISKQLEEKESKETGKQADIHENDGEFQKRVMEQYLTLAGERNWKVIECVDKGNILPYVTIAESIWKVVLPYLTK